MDIAELTPIAAPRTERQGWLLVGLCLGYFMVLLDSTIVNVALPAIAADLGGSLVGQQWTVSAYLVAFAALLLSSGAVADRYGAARVFRIGVVAFGVSSALCAVAPSLAALIVFRVIQGAAAGLIPSATLALLGLLHPGDAARHRAVGMFALVTGAGFAAGPLFGGALVSAGGWRWIFIVNVPIAVVCWVWCRALPHGRRDGVRLDLVSQVAAVVFFGALVNLIIDAGHHSRAVVPAALVTVLALAALVLVERRSTAPAIRWDVLRVGAVRRAVVWGAGVQVLAAGALFLLGLALIDGRGLGPTRAGLAIAPFTLGPLAGPYVGRLMGSRHPLGLMTTGFGCLAAGLAVVGVAEVEGWPVLVIVLGLLVAAPGLPCTIIPMTSMVVGGAPAGAGGVAGGMFNASRQIGGAIGVAALGGMIGDRVDGDAYGPALLVAAGLAVLLAVSVLLTRRADTRRAP